VSRRVRGWQVTRAALSTVLADKARVDGKLRRTGFASANLGRIDAAATVPACCKGIEDERSACGAVKNGAVKNAAAQAKAAAMHGMWWPQMYAPLAC
jgi:hypothetical protein